MMCGRSMMILALAVALAFSADARALGRAAPQDISPPLEPASSKKFFDKDYPADSRPGVDVLHFNHPYPVVQDSGDFDTDYVKDENSDNGHWKAQQEYDRLRHKLKQEKKEAEKALAKKTEEEKELKDAMDKYGSEQEKLAAAKKKKEEEEAKKAADEKKNTTPAKAEKPEGWSWSWPSWWPFSWPKWGAATEAPAPEPVKEKGSGVQDAAKDTEKAVDNLKDCQDELARAREELKKVMEELENAKAKQSEADATYDSAKKTQLETKTLAESLHGKSDKEKSDHDTAEAAYLKQKAVVDKLKVELDAAAAKVKAQRDAEDRGGGVYNTKEEKNMAASVGLPPALVLALVAVVSGVFA